MSFSVCLSVSVCARGDGGGWKSIPEPLNFQLQVAVTPQTWVLGLGLMSPGRTASTLNC